MSGFSNKINGVRAITLEPHNIKFSVFSTEEMKKLCITKITTPLTFDEMGHPLIGGLYDKTLGPLTDRGEVCGTCFKNIYNCPGHFGYIDLPLPVVNPLFHKIVGTIMKMTCLSCYGLQLPVHSKRSLELQMKLVDCGYITEAIEIATKLKELISKYESVTQIPEDEIKFIREYEKLVKEESPETAEKYPNKNTECMKNVFLSDALSEYKRRRICLECREPLDKIMFVRKKITVYPNSRKTNADDDFKAGGPKNISPTESREILRKVWGKEKDFLKCLIPLFDNDDSENPTDIFYMELIAVTPNNLRPVNFVDGRMSENQQTGIYKTIIQDCMLIRAIIQVIRKKGDTGALPLEAKAVYDSARGQTPIEKLKNAWESLQLNVDNIADYNAGRLAAQTGIKGLKQVIEKKEGILRKHMMGKRVNFSARSVITPDPYLNVDEIGIPEVFAKQLTYPVPVTSWNVAELRKMVMNGPDKHPGANMVEFEDGSLVRINPKNPTQKEGILKRLLTPDEKDTKAFRGVKRVHRHMCNGDVVLANRQPTLHKPSIMAHTVRILKNEKTIRVHYSNCKAYNADFDGDEMNVHFPQNELARSEGYNLVHVSQQYLVPKDGTPLGGLIQDYMVSGVKMTIRGKFFNKIDYQHLVFQALSFKTSEIKLLPPSIVKPVCLWSGKQIISTIIINIIPKDKHPINLTGSAKLGAKAWETSPPRPWKAGGTPFDNPNTMTEAEVIIRNGELLVGVIDKIHCGATPYGLVHCIYELYGGQYAIKLLSAFSKVFTSFLQTEGFTLGVHDILVLPHADKERRKIIKKSRKIGPEVVATALDMPKDSSLEEIVDKLEEASARNSKMRSIIDRQYKTSIDEYTNKINKVCLPAGLLCKFPENNLQLMVQSGAKGSTVNTMQISCLLGQIELEGKRPPVMISGKSLPSFPIFEFSPRAGGFIDGRFMTGIKPQEFFFHCMAGREGLIDTAVKTSRSGYLQRCLIKHLEGLTVNYDLTVRDSDKSIVQFLYGEDGMDVCKAQFLQSKQMDFLMDNSKAIIDKKVVKGLKKDPEKKKIEEQFKAIDEWKERHGSPLDKKRTSRFALFSEHAKKKLKVDKPLKIRPKTGRSKLSTAILDLWKEADDEIREGFGGYCRRCPNPVNADYQADCHYGSLSDRMKLLMDDYKSKRPIGKERKAFEDMLKFKSMQSLCSPGEPIGILAAQSIGEPSTQMTLNTFHFAGRGEMNVTLGIPRLREILMNASKTMKTPSMEIPFKDVPNLEREAEKLRKKLTRVTLENVLERIEVSAQLGIRPVRQQLYTVKFHFLPQHLYEHDYPIKAKHVIKSMTEKFFSLLFMTIRKYSKVKSVLVNIEQEKKRSRRQNNEDDDDDDDYAGGDKDKKLGTGKEGGGGGSEDDEDSDEEPEDAEDAKQTNKYSQVHEDQEPGEDEKEKEVSDDDEDGAAMDTTAMTETKEDEKKKKPTKDEDEDEEEEEEDEVGAAFSINSIKGSHSYAQNYTYDKKKYLWCELTFALPLNWKKLDLRAILKETASKCVLHEVPNIRRAITYMKKNQLTLRTDGINIIEMFKYNELLDLNKLYCNDIHKMAETYGIEAAVKVLVQIGIYMQRMKYSEKNEEILLWIFIYSLITLPVAYFSLYSVSEIRRATMRILETEITDVFEVYGIKVDPRHLSLIADYMTSGGAFEPMNRKGLQNSASPLQQISFEASLHFLKESTIRSKEDYLSNPSSCLIVGKPCQTGTGTFSVMVKIPQTVA